MNKYLADFGHLIPNLTSVQILREGERGQYCERASGHSLNIDWIRGPPPVTHSLVLRGDAMRQCGRPLLGLFIALMALLSSHSSEIRQQPLDEKVALPPMVSRCVLSIRLILAAQAASVRQPAD